nr:6-hydroxymethylpterin diphosphokinase MptE-like protein [Clostridium neonatale]
MIESSFEIEKSKDGYDIAKIKVNNKWIYVGSKYNVKLDIDRFLQKIEKTDLIESDKFIVFGFGAGEHIKKLREISKKSEILIFEPNNNLFEYARNCDLIKKDDKIKLNSCSVEEIEYFCNSEFINEFNINNIKIIDFSIYSKVYKNDFLIILTKLRDLFMNYLVITNTKIGFSERFFTAMIKNIPYICESSLFMDYKDIYKDKPAIIVSAGPSLDKNIDLLKGIEDQFVIVTGGRPLKGLLEKEIRPKLIVSIDPEDINYELMKGCIENTDLPLIYYEVTNEHILKNYSGPKILSIQGDFVNDLIDYRSTPLDCYGSVAHSMVSAAILLGCNPIIMIGQDCAYTDDNAHSTYLEEKHNDEKFEDVKSELDIWVDGVNGEKVRTSRVLNVYRLGFEEMVKKYKDVVFINATEGGARINGTIEMPLKDAINKYCNNNIEKMPIIDNDYEISKKVQEKLLEAKNNIKEIKEFCIKGEDLVKKLTINSDNSKWKSTIEKLDKLDRSMLKKMKECKLIYPLLYPTIYKIMTNSSFDKEKDMNKVKKLIIDESKILYGELIRLIDKNSKLIDEAIEEIKVEGEE